MDRTLQFSSLFPVMRVIGLHHWLRLTLFRLQIWQHLLYIIMLCYIEILIKLLTFFIQRLQTFFFISVTFLTFLF